jgi:hypothetical protein
VPQHRQFDRLKAVEALRLALEEKHGFEFLKEIGSKGVGVRLRR